MCRAMEFDRWVRVVSAAFSLALIAACSEDSKQSAFCDPPPETPMGRTYAEWGELFHKWFLSIPCDSVACENHPANDPTGANCGVAQDNEDMWFMPGTGNVSGGEGIVRDECVVPAGRALLFGPMIASCPVTPTATYGDTVEDAAATCQSIIDGATAIEVTVDGETVDDPLAYRAASGPFTIDYPDPNIFGKPPGRNEQVVSDGYWVMVCPLSAGAHTIHSRGEHAEFGYVTDATYHLTVE